ncbi:hypothetical protein INR49_004162 [Caranx melampygus]|nr:hypothetical protein INR49_004162 [Caranx melampygus]
MMVPMRRTLCRLSCLVTLVVELSWINVQGHGVHREGSRMMRQWERKVRSASSLDELLRLADFPDWKLWKCRLRLQQPEAPTETLSSPPSVGSHRSTRYAAESYSLEILKAIDEEWQRTQCMPRETCVDLLPMGQLSEARDSGRLCASGLIWDCSSDRCIPYPSATPEFPLGSWMPDCEIDVDRCDCLPKAAPTLQPRPVHRCQLNSSICAHKRQRFDQSSCRCKWPK